MSVEERSYIIGALDTLLAIYEDDDTPPHEADGERKINLKRMFGGN